LDLNEWWCKLREDIERRLFLSLGAHDQQDGGEREDEHPEVQGRFDEGV
jgi:hypothetical protein